MTTENTPAPAPAEATPPVPAADPASDSAPAPAEVTPPVPAADPASAPAEVTPPVPAADEFKPYEISAPEGVAVDKAQLEDFTKFANEFKIPKEKAEAYSHAFLQKQVEAVQANIAKWQEATETDKELGGANYEQNVGIAKKALEKFGGDAVIDVLNKTGLGNHPEIIRWAYRVGKAMSDDVVLAQSGGAPKPEPTFASALAAVANSNK